MDTEVKVFNGAVAVDDRGQLSFVNDFNFEGVKRFYMVENHDIEFIRAWHGHKEEGKYVTVVGGAAVVGLVDLRGVSDWSLIEEAAECIKFKPEAMTEDLYKACKEVEKVSVHRFVLSANKPQVIWIPPGFVNGAMNLTNDTKIIYYSTKSLGESHGDDYRFKWDTWSLWDITYR